MKIIIPAAALDQHIAILGKTGSGKSFTAKGIVERLLDGKRQVCVLDPTAAWWGLRLGADGKSRGYDVVLLGGAHADIPLSERSGAAVARLVTEQHANVVIDTSGMTVGEYTRWFIDFAGTLYTTIRSPLHLVIDEAHYFMPQGGRSSDVDAGRMLHAGNRLMSGGRSKGVRGLMITQRPAKFHKDSLTCADTLIAMRMIAPQDRGAVKEWIDGAGDPVQGKEVLNSLAQLQRGEGWVWYPEGGHLARTKFPRIRTYDSSATPTHGSEAGPAVKEINLEEVKSALAEAVKEAEANDPKLLRAEVAKLKGELAKKPQATVEADPKAIERAVAERDRDWQAWARAVDITMAAAIVSFPKDLPPHPQMPEVLTKGNAKKFGGLPPAMRAKYSADQPAPARREPSCASAQNGQLPKGERTLLIAIAQTPGGCDRTQLTVQTGYKRSSRDTYLQRLRSGGYINDGETITATQAGIDALGEEFDPLPTGIELREYWLDRLPQGEQLILSEVCGAYPDSMSREHLSKITGYQRSSRDTYLQRLSSRKLITTTREGVRASDQLFE